LQVFKDGPSSDKEKAAITGAICRRISEFMERYKWAWDVKGAKGKLTAWLDMVEKNEGC